LEHNLRTRSDFLLAATLAAILIAPGLSAARDLCIDASGGTFPTEDNPIVIGRGFRAPRPNKCAPFQGVIVSEESAVTGVACTSFDNDHVSFTLISTVSPENTIFGRGVRFYSVRFQIASATGILKIDSVGDGGPDVLKPASIYDCTGVYPDNL
jgi:hypothetical protein